MHVVTSVNTGTFTDVTYTDGTNTRCTVVLITSVRTVLYLVRVVHDNIKIPFKIAVYKLYLMTYVPSSLLKSSFGCILEIS